MCGRFDVTRESTLRSLEDYWLQETAEHAADMEPVKMVVANKVDMVSETLCTAPQGNLHHSELL